MLHAVFLHANQAWAVIFPSGELCGIGATNQHLFDSKKELKEALHRCRLGLNGNLVVALDKNTRHGVERGIFSCANS